jgi:membrane-bound lytic murein transglycosylase D
MLFRCGAYRDLIRATFIRYDVPEAVMALVLVESGCEPMARSPVGALGLFQLMPDTGRGYGLRIQENVLDERISPTKSTEAGVRFLSDLYAKLGSWDLAFAAYNMGPFGLLARVQRAGGDVGFWDLLDADLLPDETAQYVPRIQALALILSNLQRLRFAGLQMRAPEDTSELEVPSGTRLGLIARAASTSLDLVRRLNRDILGDRVPAVPSGRFVVQVPASVVEQARESLGDLVRSRNEEDLCVPSSFDWGRSRFTPEMAEACKKKLADLDPEPGSAAPP